MLEICDPVAILRAFFFFFFSFFFFEKYVHNSAEN